MFERKPRLATDAVVDKYRQPSHVQRASLMSATWPASACATCASAPNFAAMQALTTALVLSLTRPARPPSAQGAGGVCDRRLLWRFGISGRPADGAGLGRRAQGLGLLRALAQALGLWAWGGVACDLVVVNAEAASYQMALQRDIAALRDRHARPGGSPDRWATASPAARRASCPPDELGTLRPGPRGPACRRPPLLHHVQAWRERTSGPGAARLRLDHRVAGGRLACGAAPRRGRFQRARRVPLRGRRRCAPGAALDQRAVQSRLWRPDFRIRWRLHLGNQQPAEPADRLVERPRGRPAVRMVPAAGPAQPGGLERGAVGLGRRARAATRWRTARATPASATAAATWRSPPPGAWTPTGA
ncbi:MAG: hypothetical protein IPO11_14005 [Betaproteobacteria bacterium]|nr:hypothetical protein [Betaproteobacteria bacterium]